MSEKLIPCPICGSENTVRLPYNDRADIERCKNCNLTIIVPFGCTMWNTRPIEDALRKRIAELEAARRWRIVADGELPEHDGEYWVWLEAWNTPHKRGACIYSKDYHDNNGFFNLIPVTHWMPLPELPEERQ